MKTCSISFAVALLATVVSTQSEAIGLGVSVDDDSGNVYLPLDAGGMLVEPFIQYGQEESDLDGRSRDMTLLQVGLGLFLRQPLAEKTVAYYGARAYWVQMDVDMGKQTQDGDGHGFAPTVGIEYAFAEKAAIALEASLEYSNLSQTMDDAGTSRTLEEVDYRSAANLVMRFYF